MIVNARELSRTYQHGQERIAALQSINLDIETGEFVFIVGPNGGGKSTLLHLLGGMDRPSSGHLLVNGIDLAAASETQLNRFRREQVGFVFQFYNLLGTLSALFLCFLPLMLMGCAPNVTGKIAFMSDRDGNPEVYVMNADGSNPINLTNNPGYDTSPAWSPENNAHHRTDPPWQIGNVSR